MTELSKEEKVKYVESKGWTTLWNESNWVHYGIMAGANIDMCGISLDSAYDLAKRS